jgi:uncharacterized membrane protein
MKSPLKGALIAAAVAGLFAANASLAADDGKKEAKDVKCAGINACKGHGACAGAGHDCAGKNGCKGQGWDKGLVGERVYRQGRQGRPELGFPAGRRTTSIRRPSHLA